MTDETANLVLEHLRGLPADMAAMREEMRGGLTTLSQRVDGLETELRGLSYVVTASIGSLLADAAETKQRLTRLEDA